MSAIQDHDAARVQQLVNQFNKEVDEAHELTRGTQIGRRKEAQHLVREIRKAQSTLNRRELLEVQRAFKLANAAGSKAAWDFAAEPAGPLFSMSSSPARVIPQPEQQLLLAGVLTRNEGDLELVPVDRAEQEG